MTSGETTAYLAALQWHLDQGIDEILADTPGQLGMATPATSPAINDIAPAPLATMTAPEKNLAPHTAAVLATLNDPSPVPTTAAVQGTPALRTEAQMLAQQAHSLTALQAALNTFEGLSVRKSATHLVFAAGTPGASVMVIGDAPGTDDDRSGQPFSGPAGLLLDRILQSIGLARDHADPAQAAYLTQILNWRPPGNRSPTEAEMEISLPFIEQHIALARPRLLLLCGGLTAQTLLGHAASISKLRGHWHTYMPRAGAETYTSNPASNPAPIPALVTYHPAYLLTTPGQKRAVWADMLMLAEKRRELGISAVAA
ncbi:MAG: uracil-DNA glycosylase [Alphaproteobacteria bacterium]|nr:uracil-DNA glycosylase [Alphaproteobacteria bacterium]